MIGNAYRIGICFGALIGLAYTGLFGLTLWTAVFAACCGLMMFWFSYLFVREYLATLDKEP